VEAGLVRARRRHDLAVLVALAFGCALTVAFWGGYDRKWRWTGFERNATLWDWLHMSLLPLALAAVPLWLRYRRRLRLVHHATLVTTATAFGLLVVLGYSLDWSWTGFPGNRLWDWLELLVLPLAIALVPVWADAPGRMRPRHLVALGAAVAGLTTAAIGGYRYGWRWTGFEGNTLFDWIQLLIAPLVLPLVFVPMTTSWLTVDPDAPAAEDAKAPPAQPVREG
jgi:hypothetical protein